MDVIRPVMHAELLILDDLGAERLTDWVEETMNVIVNSRYNAKLPTIFTSNYEDIPGSEDMSSLLVRVGFRLHSRLREMCEFLEYDGPDYRDLPPNADADDIYKLWKGQPRRKLAIARIGVGPRPAARADGTRRQSRSEVAGRQGGIVAELGRFRMQSAAVWRVQVADLPAPDASLTSISQHARPVHSRSVLFRHLQLLQLQSRPVRRRAEGAVCRGADCRDPRRWAGWLQASRSPRPTPSFSAAAPRRCSNRAEIQRSSRPAGKLRPGRGSRSHARSQPRKRHRRTARGLPSGRRQSSQLRRPVISRRRARRLSRLHGAARARAAYR